MKMDAIAEKIAKLKEARDIARHAEKDLHMMILTLFPVGAAIRWKRAGRLQFGTVQDLSYADSLFVTNAKTGATLKISVYDMIEAMEIEEAA